MRLARLSPAQPRVLLSSLVAAALTGAPLISHAQPVGEPPYCEAPVVRREMLRSERGNPLYLSPEAMLERDGELLLAGQFSAEFVRQGQGMYDIGEQNHVLAVLRRRDGTVRTFGHFPIDGREPADVRVVALGREGWGVLVLGAVRDSQPRIPRRGALYFAPLTEAGWGAVVTVPLPAGVQPVAPMARHMVQQGDRIIASMNADSGGSVSGILLVERRGGVWRSRFIGSPSVSYTALALDGGTNELAMAVVAVNRATQRDRNSLFLSYPDRKHDSLKLLVSGLEAPVHHPRMHSTSRGLSLAWTAHLPVEGGVSMRAMQLAVESGLPLAPRQLASSPGFVTTIADRFPLAIVVSAHASDSLALALYFLPAPSVGVRLTYRSSFAEVADATRGSGSEIVVALLAASSDGSHLIKELLWIEPRCRSDAGRDSATGATSPDRRTPHVPTLPLAGSSAAVRKRM